MKQNETEEWLEREIQIADKWLRLMDGQPMTRTVWEIRKKALEDCRHAMRSVMQEIDYCIKEALHPTPVERVKPMTKRQAATEIRNREKIRKFLHKHSFLLKNYSPEP